MRIKALCSYVILSEGGLLCNSDERSPFQILSTGLIPQNQCQCFSMFYRNIVF